MSKPERYPNEFLDHFDLESVKAQQLSYRTVNDEELSPDDYVERIYRSKWPDGRTYYEKQLFPKSHLTWRYKITTVILTPPGVIIYVILQLLLLLAYSIIKFVHKIAPGIGD